MHYTALDTKKHQIRLLHLAPSPDRRRAITCHFRTISLSHDTQQSRYEALSYAWGDPIFNRSIKLGGSHFAVTANLRVILRALRLTHQERVLWIDAVCIDQHNIQERSHQVSRMNDIYSHAANVVIWLGEPLSDAALAFNFLQEFGRQRNELPMSTDEDRNTEQTAMAVRSLLMRSWWTRIWTAQEWILAGSTTFQSGQYTLGGDVLIRCLEHYRYHAKSTDCCGMHLTSDILFRLGDSLQPLFALDAVRQSYSHQDFSSSLGYLRMRQAADPRDKVYGVLALAASQYAGLLRADYSAAVEQVYEQLAIALIDRTKRLDIFSHIVPNQPQRLSVASWAPDWTVDMGKEYSSDWTERFRMIEKYDACGTCDVAEYRAVSSVLHIKGLVVDTIAALGIRRLGSYKKTRAYRNQLLDEMFKMAEPIDTGYYHRYHGQRQTKKEAFWLTVCGGYEDMTQERTQVISEPHMDDFEMFEKWEAWFRGPRISYQTHDHRLRSVTDSIAAVSKGRTFCRTAAQGLLGWVPKNSVTGDVVAVLTGGTMPIVLRPHDGYCTVVGDAYVHGIMDGEALHSSSSLSHLELH
ncbi:HET-domain-containing protein [Didymella exigua CBS 183.55]|uniref:HET-domain-containing protein n=1 Tax=Didymella exigua CBS 183.55 TaxID=1150837 RepID=A0A6A5R687_9PLEO|nr:HET-domain-containing protein [Didymella exigua CBS 183.55]KAF1922698.1 HET-domain-containing protein [Didymella exigua CBS 183.55]